MQASIKEPKENQLKPTSSKVLNNTETSAAAIKFDIYEFAARFGLS